MKAKNRYFAYGHNVDGALRNGSFVRISKYGIGQFMNGDYMGMIEKVPDHFVEVDADYANGLIPWREMNG